MTNTTSTTPASASQKALNSPMRDLVRAVLFYVHQSEASLTEIRYSIREKFCDDDLPRNWKVQVRDVLKHDPEVEKTEDDNWVLRTQGSNVA